MEKETRSAIERATQRARHILEADFVEQLQGDYDVMLDGRVGETAGAHLVGRQKALRARIVAAVQHKRMAGMAPKEAVADYLRDAAFTTLNRFVALKMLEARGLVQECITKGDASYGFVGEYLAFAKGAKFPDGSGYRLYIESIFDELSTEVKVLFDRRDPAAALWPRRATFEELLEILNAPDLTSVWGEDETIGWVYQYFNSGDERRKMREESQAPRNSRELAIRNQFFTPRYVVQFLSDNTLGRIWYEMRKGETQLVNVCQYMVRQVDEVFADGAAPVDGKENVESHRAAKDPRDLRIIDPACGSGHFLLYCFQLLLTIYEEAWGAEDAPVSEVTGRRLREDYPDVTDLRRAIPALILGHNLHGVDIDPRCAQIAQLALWMRAQRAYQDHGIARSDRPIIRRSNIVIAEPMPGDAGLVDEFAATLNPPVLGHLFKEIVGEMTLAGEMGTLLPIEKRIVFSIQQARKDFVEQQRRSAQGFLPGLAPEHRQTELDLSGIDDDSFFAQAEEKIFASLKHFAADAVNGVGARRRLFADDAQQGIAFIDLSRKDFDVVLMNPPFGESTKSAFIEVKKRYPDAYYDLLACFIERGLQLSTGLLGCLGSESCLYGKYLAAWRSRSLIPGADYVVDLGDGVLDAVVKTAALVVQKNSPATEIRFIDVTSSAEKEQAIAAERRPIGIPREDFYRVPNQALVHSMPSSVRALFSKFPKAEQRGVKARSGLTTYDDDRFLRLLWEAPPSKLGAARKWIPIFKGGGAHTFYNDVHLVVNFEHGGREVGAFNYLLYGTDAQSRRASDYYYREGCCYGRAAGRWFAAKPLFSGMVFGDKGPAIVSDGTLSPNALLSFLNSDPVRYLLHTQAQGGGIRTLHIETGLIDELPLPEFSRQDRDLFESAAREAIAIRENQHAISELEPVFDPSLYTEPMSLRERRDALEKRLRDGDVRIMQLVSAVSAAVGRNFALEPEVATSFPPLEQHRAVDLHAMVTIRAVAISLVSFAIGKAFRRFAQKSPASTDGPSFPLMGVYAPVGGAGDAGFLVDDAGHPRDIAAAVGRALSESGTSVEEVEEVLGADLRTFISKQFFDMHRTQYSRSRRKSPVYWQLATPSASYSVWVYFHDLNKDTLFRLRNDVINPKLDLEKKRLEELRSEEAARSARALRDQIEQTTRLVDDLTTMRNYVSTLASLWHPKLDDGVVVNFAMLWRLVPHTTSWQKDLRAKWEDLVSGKCDWTGMAMHLWPERVIGKCAEDRSLAIAHGLEDVFWFEDDKAKWNPRTTPLRPIEELVAERTSSAVKDALKRVLEAPEPVAPGKRGRKGKTS
jgi:hypothetical protein